MTPERADRLQRLFNAALLHPTADRIRFIDAACPDDPDLYQHLLTLLQADDQAQEEAFLEAPAVAWAAETDTEDPFVGTEIGPYSTLARIGRGGMGDVYLALRKVPFRQYVALKVIRRGMDSQDILQRFEMERQILASLNHPHIARLLDGGITPDGRSYFVMEYVEGEPLTDYCDTAAMDLNARLRLFQSVCHAVHYAHQNLIVHRDLKPSNILVSAGPSTGEGPTVKLLDFGVAKLLNPHLSPVDTPITRTELRVMTPAYASPEQVRGQPLTTASDVYSLGVILYELLTGHRPYRLQDKTAQHMIQVVCEQTPPRPSTRVTETASTTGPEGNTVPLPPERVSQARGLSPERLQRRLRGDLDNIVMMALRKEPARRYASAEQLAEDVQRYLDGLPVRAHQDSRAYRLRKFTNRHRSAVLIGGGLALLLAAFSVVTLLQSVQLRRQAVVVAEAQTRTEQALAASEEVTGFLMTLFESNNPNEALGDTLTAPELLARGVARIEDLADQPLLQARMMAVLGEVYYNLGQYDQAEPLLEQALVLRRTHAGEDHLEVAQSLRLLGSLRTKQDDYETAETLQREALAIRLAQLDEHHMDVASSMNSVAYVLDGLRTNDEEAERLYRKSLAIRRALKGDDHPEVALALNNLGYFLHRRGRRAEAAAHYRDALAIRRTALGDAHPDVAITLNNLGVVLRQMGDLEAAAQYQRESVQIRRKTLGQHPSVIRAMLNLGYTLLEKKDFVEAETVCREALSLGRDWLGEPSTEFHRALHLMGDIHMAQGDLDTAEANYREVLRLRRQYRGAGHQMVGRSLYALGLVLHRKAAYPEAEAAFQAALTVYKPHYSDDHRHVKNVHRNLAALYTAWGRPELAARYTEVP